MGKTIEIGTKYAAQLTKDIFSYFRLKDWMNQKAKAFLTRIQKHEFNSLSQFWGGILKKKSFAKYDGYEIKDGDIVTFRGDFFLSDWLPRNPGLLWTIEGRSKVMEGEASKQKILKIDNTKYHVYDLPYKERIILGGYGSIRHRATKIGDNYAILGLCDLEHWFCDMGIPIVVSQQVYSELQRARINKGAAAISKLTGQIILEEPLPYTQAIPEAIGAKLSNELIDALSKIAYLPTCYIKIISPLDIRLLANNSHPDCIAWALFTHKERYLGIYKPELYGYTFKTFNPTNEESIRDATRFIYEYIYQFRGRDQRIITDFDGKQPRLLAELPLSRNIWKKRSDKEKIKNMIINIDNSRGSFDKLFRWRD